MRRIVGVLWVIAVAAVMLYLLPPAFFFAVDVLWNLTTGGQASSSEVNVPTMFGAAAAAVSVLSFGLAWLAVRVGRAPLYAWLGALAATGLLVGGMGFGGGSGPGVVAGTIGVIGAGSFCAFVGARLGGRHRPVSDCATMKP